MAPTNANDGDLQPTIEIFFYSNLDLLPSFYKLNHGNRLKNLKGAAFGVRQA